jgi:DegV family protein with EDD domain
MKISVVTDSTSDLPKEVAAQYGIEIVPNLLTIENVSYLDGVGISREDYYNNLSRYRNPPTTAAPSPEVYSKVYQRILDQGTDLILSFHPARTLSALFSVATIGSEGFGTKVQVIDSNNVSLGLGFQTLNAARAIARGASLEEILSIVERVKEKVRVFAMLDTLVHVRRSGRVNWVSASLASMLGLKAIIEVRNGVVHRLALSRSRVHALVHLKEIIEREGMFTEAAILHTSTLSSEDTKLLLEDFPRLSSPPMVVPITPVIGTHVGPGCVGVALVLQ